MLYFRFTVKYLKFANVVCAPECAVAYKASLTEVRLAKSEDLNINFEMDG